MNFKVIKIGITTDVDETKYNLLSRSNHKSFYCSGPYEREEAEIVLKEKAKELNAEVLVTTIYPDFSKKKWWVYLVEVKN